MQPCNLRSPTTCTAFWSLKHLPTQYHWRIIRVTAEAALSIRSSEKSLSQNSSETLAGTPLQIVQKTIKIFFFFRFKSPRLHQKRKGTGYGRSQGTIYFTLVALNACQPELKRQRFPSGFRPSTGGDSSQTVLMLVSPQLYSPQQCFLVPYCMGVQMRS